MYKLHAYIHLPKSICVYMYNETTHACVNIHAVMFGVQSLSFYLL